MALPPDGSPTLEGHPDNGKKHGKVWLNEAVVVSKDHGEELRYSSAPQSVDCSTSFSGDEVGNEDQDDLRPEKSRPIGTLQHHQVGLEEDAVSLTSGHSRKTTQKVDSAKADDPPSKLSSGAVLLSSFKFTSGLEKKQESILRPEKSRPITTLQRHEVGLEEKGASLTSRRARRITDMVYAVKQEDPPSKLSFGTVLPSSFKFTSGFDEQDKPILRPEDSGPIGISQQPLGGWKNLVASLTFGHTRRATKKVDAAKADDPSSKPSHQVGLKEDAAHVTSVIGINGKRRKDSDAEEQPPTKRIRENQADDKLPSKRTRDTVAKEEPPAKRTKVGLPPSGDLFSAFRGRPLAEKDFPAKRTRDSVAKEEPPAKRTRDSVANVLKSCKDAGLSPLVLRPSCKMARKRPILSSPVLSPSPLTHCEDPIMSPRVFSPPPRMLCDTEEDPKPSTSSGITARESSRHVWFRPRYVPSSDSE